jgi:hypothetical protein
LNRDRHLLLKRYRDTLAADLGRPVSLAEAVFIVLENRALEVERFTTRHEYHQTPTIVLHRIRTRWESERTLSAAQWDMLAEYVCVGTDHEQQPPPFQPVIPSSASCRAVLDAFKAVYQLRRNPSFDRIWTYFDGLRGDESPIRLSPTDVEERERELDSLIEYRRQHSIASEERPRHLGRCFLTAVRNEGVDSTMLDRCLAPYWPVLWRLAARGHWLRHNYQPIRIQESGSHPRLNWPILSSALSAGDVKLSFSPADGPEFTTMLELARPRGVRLQLREYPRFAEFRAMLDGPEDRPWQGRYFIATPTPDAAPATRSVLLRGDLSIRIDLSAQEWQTVRDLLRQGLQDSAVQWRLRTLEQEYGEHA